MSAEQVTQGWQETVARKRKLQAEAVAAFADTGNGVAGAKEGVANIAEASTLVNLIALRTVTCESVVREYITNAIKAQTSTNCLTEVLFEDAVQRAQELDSHLAEHGRPVGPLHGVPITLKDQFDVKGWDTTLGYVGSAFAPATADAAIVTMLRSLGAVMLAKTNLPQSIMWCETDNPLFGLTTNPTSKDYTPGGSTGGESALLTCHGSLLGWGTDIGGSIRIPSHMMGLYGLKPSSARLPYRGVQVSTDGQEHVPSSVGPLARSLDTVHLSMKSLIDLKPWELDARCTPIPWREDLFRSVLDRPLVFGVLLDDGVVRPHPPIMRVLQSVVEKLRAAGHHIVEWNAQLHPECIEVMDAFYTVDGGEDIRRAVAAGGEPFIPHVERLVNRGEAISVYEYWQLNRRKFELQHAYLDKWASIRCPATGQPVDAILMPPMPHTAVPHESCRWVGYTKVWNVLDYTAMVIPGGSVLERDLQTPWVQFEPRNVMDEFNLKLWTDHGSNMAQLQLPVGVQIVGRKLEEEKVLGIAQVVDNLLKQ
ncbi:amidase [Thozetella sp. PMI_491]|nr:amidase [Thozetella sp. PMI_491]